MRVQADVSCEERTIDVGSEAELRVLCEGLSDIGVCAIRILVFLIHISRHSRIIFGCTDSFENIIHPVEHFLRNGAHGLDGSALGNTISTDRCRDRTFRPKARNFELHEESRDQ